MDRLKLVAAAILTVAVVKTFFIDVVVVDGMSMEPTLHSGDVLLVDKLTPRLGLLKPGQIVVLSVGMPEDLMIKRIVAVGGDSVVIRSGHAMVNGVLGPGETDAIPAQVAWGPVSVPCNRLLVLGDNRPWSIDGTDFGPVPTHSVKGRVIRGLSTWTGAAASSVRRLVHRGSPQGTTQPAILAQSAATMAHVTAAHVRVGEAEIWISEEYGVRRNTERGFTVFTNEGTWSYDRHSNTVTVSCPVHVRFTARENLQHLSGALWLGVLSAYRSPYACTEADDSIGDKAAVRVQTKPGRDGRGVSIWIDADSRRVLAMQEWRMVGGTAREIAPRARLDYDTRIDRDTFVASVPADVRVVDRRTAACHPGAA